MKRFITLCCMLFTSFCFAEDLSAPYNEIEVMPEHLHGWFNNNNELDHLFSQHEISTVIELGSWMGKSALYFARKVGEKGKVYAVDHWRGSVEHVRPEVAQYLPTLYEQFLSNVIHADLTETIVPVRMSTREAATFLDVKADLIYIDASHDEESVYEDLCLYYPKLAEGGILCGDDWEWPYSRPGKRSVACAIRRFAKKHNLSIIHSKRFWWLAQPRALPS